MPVTEESLSLLLFLPLSAILCIIIAIITIMLMIKDQRIMPSKVRTAA